MKKLIYLIVIFAFSGCRSTFLVESDQHQEYQFEFCGGQQWGYVKPVAGDKSKGTYLGSYLENHILKEPEAIVFYFVIYANEALDFNFQSKKFIIRIDDQTVYDKTDNFVVSRLVKDVRKRFSSNFYSYKKVEGTSNQWNVRKRKYGGFFGDIWGDWTLEEPVLVTLPEDSNEEIKSNKASITFNTETDDNIFVVRQISIPLINRKIKTSQILVTTPAFEANGVQIPESTYTFHMNREKLLAAAKDAYRCASMEEVFRHKRK